MSLLYLYLFLIFSNAHVLRVHCAFRKSHASSKSRNSVYEMASRVILLNHQVSIRHTGEGRYPGHANKCRNRHRR